MYKHKQFKIFEMIAELINNHSSRIPQPRFHLAKDPILKLPMKDIFCGLSGLGHQAIKFIKFV